MQTYLSSGGLGAIAEDPKLQAALAGSLAGLAGLIVASAHYAKKAKAKNQNPQCSSHLFTKPPDRESSIPGISRFIENFSMKISILCGDVFPIAGLKTALKTSVKDGGSYTEQLSRCFSEIERSGLNVLELFSIHPQFDPCIKRMLVENKIDPQIAQYSPFINFLGLLTCSNRMDKMTTLFDDDQPLKDVEKRFKRMRIELYNFFKDQKIPYKLLHPIFHSHEATASSPLHLFQNLKGLVRELVDPNLSERKGEEDLKREALTLNFETCSSDVRRVLESVLEDLGTG